MLREKNEGKVCCAVARLLEKKLGLKVSNLWLPEVSKQGPPVDLRFDIGDQKFAIEHTEIEAFPGQIESGKKFGDLIEAVEKELSGTLPKPGTYYGYFPLWTRVKGGEREMAKVREALKDWIKAGAKELCDAHPRRLDRDHCPRGITTELKGSPPGMEFEVTLQRRVHWAESGVHDGVFLVARSAPKDFEDSRKTLLQKSFDRKAPSWPTVKRMVRLVFWFSRIEISLYRTMS